MLGEFGGENNDGALNEETARLALADYIELNNLALGADTIDAWIRDARQIVGPDLSPSVPSGVVTTPAATSTVVPETFQIDAPVAGSTADADLGADFFIGAEGPTSADPFLGTDLGQRASFSDFIQRFRPGSSRFLRTGLQQRFDPMQTAFNVQSALGTLPGRTEDQAGQLGTPVNFRQWMENYGGGIPTQKTWQSMLGGVSDWLTGGRDTAGVGSMGESFMTNENNQFNLALQSILQNVPYHLRPAAKATAEREFRQFQAQNPGRTSEWLPAWQSQGQKWNPTLPAMSTMSTTTGI